MFNRKTLCRGVLATLLLPVSTSLIAATTTYNYTITGDVLIGQETIITEMGGYETVTVFNANNFNLETGSTISAFGTFTADSSLFSGTGGTVTFDGIVNSMTINLNGYLITAADSTAAPTLSFNSSGHLYDFDYLKTTSFAFNSSFIQFDDLDGMYGEWRSVEVTAVPEAETYAMMLAGLGLVGWMGVRRKSRAT